jgi:hypothetical protein
MSTLKIGDPVKIHRPNKKEHGWLGRYIEPIQVEGGQPFGWVAFDKKDKGAALPPSDWDKLRRQENYPRTFFPLSQILPYEQAI